MNINKTQPKSLELEAAVLGACLIEADAYAKISDIITPSAFYNTANEQIFITIQNLNNKSIPIDLLTVSEELRKLNKLAEIGGISYLNNLTNIIGSSANIEVHSRILLQKQIQRDLINTSDEVSELAYSDNTDVFDLLEIAERNFDRLRSTIFNSQIKTATQIWSSVKKDILVPPEVPLSVPSVLGMRHDLGTIDCFGAKPGTGKTAVMIQGSVEASKQGYNVGILSLELSGRLLLSKIQHHCLGISAQKIIRNELKEFEKEKIFTPNDYNNDILNRIYIDDTTTTSINIRSKVVALAKKHDCKVVWIDYVQLVSIYTNKGQSDVKGMESMMSILQNTAKELNICIIVLSQLTRVVERPSMEELRGGGIEQACTKIVLLNDTNQKENAGKPFLEIPDDIRGKIEFINDKERFGDKSVMLAYYDKIAQVFCDWNDRDLSKYNEYIPQQNTQPYDMF